jgi:hypothetical protein
MKFEIQKQGLETKERLEIKTKGKIRNWKKGKIKDREYKNGIKIRK